MASRSCTCIGARACVGGEWGGVCGSIIIGFVCVKTHAYVVVRPRVRGSVHAGCARARARARLSVSVADD